MGLGLVVDPAARRSAAVALIALAGLAATGCAVLAVTAAGSGAAPGRRRRAVALAIVALAVAVLSAAVHVQQLAAAPLAEWATDRAMATLEVRVDGDPRALTGRADGSRRQPDTVQARAHARAVRARGQEIAVDVPLVLRLPAALAGEVQDGVSLRVSGRLGPARPGDDAAAALTVRSPPVLLAGAGPVAAGATALRGGLRTALEGAPADAAALVAGLAVGDEGLQRPDLADDMRRAGLSHLTAVSGGNVALVLIVVLAAARLLGLRARGRVALSLLALAGFVVLVRPQASVLRAAVMGCVGVLALLAGGRRAGMPALAAAVLVLVVIAPPLAASVGFALSAAATAGLLILAPPLRAWLAGLRFRTVVLPPALVDALAVTLAAHLATVPLVAALGGGIGLAAVPANLLAAPAVAPVTVLGLGSALLSPVLPAGAVALARVAAWPAGWIAGVAHACAGLPAAAIPWPSGPPGAALALVATLAVGATGRTVMRRWRPRRSAVASMAGLALAAAIVVAIRPPGQGGWPPPGWVLVMCDVGQGDALVLASGPGHGVVVDAGPDPDAVDRCLRDLGVTAVDLLVLTHAHADHVEGVPGVLRGRSVAGVLVSPLRDPADEAFRVDGWLAQAGLAEEVGSAGAAGAVGTVSWRVLWPRRVIREGSAPNNTSIVLLVEDGGLRLLLGADVEPAAQVALRAGLGPLGADVVKVPHHGSSHQDPGFPAWTGARIALVSVGADNDYGHPDPGTLAAWAGLGALVARTDRDGDVAVVTTRSGRAGLVTRR